MKEVVIEYLRFSRKKERVRYGADTTEISLRGMDIQEIEFIEYGSLNDLRVLDLSDNKLETIDLEFLRSSSSLQEIDVRDNEILSLDTSTLQTLEELRELKVSGNLIKAFDLSGLTGCKELKLLNISNNHIHRIDLSPLCSCSGLVEINAQGNQLDSIDISPLESARDLRTLNLSHNWIREIDLTPLSGNTALLTLDLSENPLMEIDLTPLQGCISLETLVLDWTQLASIDLSSLSSCGKLRRLSIAHNKISDIDLWPLVECQQLAVLDISGNMSLEFSYWPLFTFPYLDELGISSSPEPTILHPPDSVSWSLGLEQYRKNIQSYHISDTISETGLVGFTGEIAEIHSHVGPLGRFFVRVAVLDVFDLSDFIGYDCDIVQVLNKMRNSYSYEETRSELKTVVSRGLIEQVRSGGSTHLIDVKRASGVPELAVITASTLELRRHELEQVVLSHDAGKIDLRLLWFTSYGFDILSALCMGLSTNLQGIERIRMQLIKEGIEFQIQNGKPVKPNEVRISDELKAYILMHARQCGRQTDLIT